MVGVRLIKVGGRVERGDQNNIFSAHDHKAYKITTLGVQKHQRGGVDTGSWIKLLLPMVM